MIDLDVDLSYLSRYYSLTSIMGYTGQTGGITETADGEEALTIVTEDGVISINADLMEKLLQEPEKLAKILQLENVNNTYLIIQQLNEDDLDSLLPFLTSEQLSFGLQYFTVDGLAALMEELPQEQMIFLLMQHFTMADVVPFMQTNEMDEFFQSPTLDKDDVMEYFEGLDYEKFQTLMVNQFGYDYKTKGKKEYLSEIENMDDKAYQEFLLNMQTFEKGELITGLCEINEDYYYEFENSILMRPMVNTMDKGDIVKTMSSLEVEFLAPMIEQLPKDLVQIVATQIDPTVFSDILSSEFPDMIMEMLAGN